MMSLFTWTPRSPGQGISIYFCSRPWACVFSLSISACWLNSPAQGVFHFLRVLGNRPRIGKKINIFILVLQRPPFEKKSQTGPEILSSVALSKLASLPSAGRGGAATPFTFPAPSGGLCPSTLQVGPTKCQTSSCTAQGLWAVCSSPLFVPLPTHTHLGLHQLPAHCSPFPPCDLILIPPAPLQGADPFPTSPN